MADLNEPSRSETYHDEEGDLEIVASDNVLLKIHTFYLQAASQVHF